MTSKVSAEGQGFQWTVNWAVKKPQKDSTCLTGWVPRGQLGPAPTGLSLLWLSFPLVGLRCEPVSLSGMNEKSHNRPWVLIPTTCHCSDWGRQATDCAQTWGPPLKSLIRPRGRRQWAPHPPQLRWGLPQDSARDTACIQMSNCCLFGFP